MGEVPIHVPSVAHGLGDWNSPERIRCRIVGLPALHNPSTTNPAALYAVRIHRDDYGCPGYAEAMIGDLRNHLPKGAAVVDRSDLYPRETMAGTVKSIRLVDALVMIGKQPADKHSTPTDQRIDLDPIQREIAELSVERSGMVSVRTRYRYLYL